MSKLLEAIAHDAEHVLESELPAVGDVRALLVGLARRLEAELPQLAERSTEDVLQAIAPEQPAADSSPADVPPVATSPAPLGANVTPAGAPSTPAPGSLATDAGAPPSPVPGTGPAGPAADAAESPLDAELADARQRVIELEAQRATASQTPPSVATSDTPAETSPSPAPSASELAPIASEPASAPTPAPDAPTSDTPSAAPAAP